uniref:Transporter n=1 Tax=Geobacillus sp. (strain Y4.1MC1) TaxID=581103 RepID=A0A7U3YHJ6_GEOS0
MGVELTVLHWIYLAFIVLIIGFMIARKDTSLVCIVGIFLLSVAATYSLSAAISGVFHSFIYAMTELLPTILVISIIVAMSKAMTATGINDVMVSPFTRFIRTPGWAYWTIGILMMVISCFFWPSPAVALMGAVLLPVAIRVGLPPLGAAMTMNLFGHGVALSGDFVIQGAPKLTADAAGLPVSEVIAASVPLVLVMGATTTLTAFLLLRRDMKRGYFANEANEVAVTADAALEKTERLLSSQVKNMMAAIIPAMFVFDVITMFYLHLQGGEATALIGGTAIFILILISIFAHKKESFGEITNYLVEGFQFGIKVFAPVVPIAAFFYLGDAGFAKIIGEHLPKLSQGIVNDLGVALAHIVPLNNGIGAVTLTVVGAITGLDGSGFSGISLAGSVAHLFATAIGGGAATLTALGQIAAIWVGGGTLVPWALIPAAAICGVDPFELARRNLVPVTVGIVITTIVAMFLM